MCCPITYVPVDKLRQPVAFRCMPQHVYECDDLLEWLREKSVNPMTNLEVSWRNSPLECIGPVAGMHDPALVESKIVLALNGDAMQIEKILYNRWVQAHVVIFLLATTDILTQKYVFYGDCCAIGFALYHWLQNARAGSYTKKISLLTVVAMLLAGECTVESNCFAVLNDRYCSAACCVFFHDSNDSGTRMDVASFLL